MQTSVIKKTLLATVTLLWLGLAAPQGVGIETRGVRSCGAWISQVGTVGLANRTWFIGFLTGIAFMSNKDFLHGTDNESLYLWLDNYCRSNPLKMIDDGGYLLFLELVKQKRL